MALSPKVIWNPKKTCSSPIAPRFEGLMPKRRRDRGGYEVGEKVVPVVGDHDLFFAAFRNSLKSSGLKE